MPALKEAPNLKPCPFCGNELQVKWDRPNPSARCVTDGCIALQMSCLSLDVPGVIEAWNTRAEAEITQGDLSAIRTARAQGQAHPDDEAVDRFAAAMKAKLAKKRAEGRGGLEDKNQCSAEFLNRLLNEHVGKGDPIDVSNLAMMLWNRGERTEVVRTQGQRPFSRELLVNLILCSLQIRMEVTNVVDATKAAEHIVDTYMTPKFYPGQAEREPVARLSIQALLKIYDEEDGDWCKIARAVERHYAAPLRTKNLTDEIDRLCAAIKAEDDYCVDNGDYMLDSNDCIKIIRGEWVRPDFDVSKLCEKKGSK